MVGADCTTRVAAADQAVVVAHKTADVITGGVDATGGIAEADLADDAVVAGEPSGAGIAGGVAAGADRASGAAGGYLAVVVAHQAADRIHAAGAAGGRAGVDSAVVVADKATHRSGARHGAA